MQHAAASSIISTSAIQSPEETQFKCDQYNFSSKSKRGLKVHIGRSHKDIQITEVLRGGELENSLNVSELSQNREEGSSLVKADQSALSSTPLKELINDSVSESSADDSEDEAEPPHKCPPFNPCSKAECKLRVAREREEDALEKPCTNCDIKIYKYECCSEESGLCPDCCDELGACLNMN